MEKWKNYLFHSLGSLWSNNGAYANYLFPNILNQLVKLELIIDSKHIYSYDNIQKNIDFEYAQQIYENLLHKYCDVSVFTNREKQFKLNRNCIKYNRNDFVSLISKYPESGSNFWFEHFCWGHNYEVDPLYSIYATNGYHPYRIVINLIISKEILEHSVNRLQLAPEKINGEIQILNSVPFEYIKGIAIGTQQNNEIVNSKLSQYYENYCRRLNVIVYEIEEILKKFNLNLPIYDIITEKPFEIMEANKRDQEKILSKKFTNDPRI